MRLLQTFRNAFLQRSCPRATTTWRGHCLASQPQNEPDAAVLPGTIADYDRAHPRSALLVVEVADTSLKQDRLTKRAIYAAACIPEYWIPNLVDDVVEVRRDPEPEARRYRRITIARRSERSELALLPGVSVAVDDLLPSAPAG